jgi:V8-like Glu-specific endopeptidase
MRFLQVFGSDEREQRHDTTGWPWRAQCKLFMLFPNGKRYVGSGTLIGRKYVISAGHCVFREQDGGWAEDVRVIPGLHDTFQPYGAATSLRLRSFTGWTDFADYDHDLALITLDRNLGDATGWVGYACYDAIDGVTGNIAGYPGDLTDGLGLWYSYGPIQSSTTYRAYYWIDTSAGQSGASTYKIVNGSRFVFAVHCGPSSIGGHDLNRATRLTPSKFDSIARWIESGY